MTDKPDDMMMEGGKVNRTGISLAPKLSAEMIKGSQDLEPTPGDENVLKQMRGTYIQEASPIGTIPPPATLTGVAKTALSALKGDRASVLLDKMAERLAFERGGTRLYQALIGKFEITGTWPQGPTMELLVKFCQEEAAHFHMLKQAIEEMGGDPTAMTPSADLVAVETMGVMQVITDPRTTLGQSLHALLMAELADREGWKMLIQLAEQMGQDVLVKHFSVAQVEEEVHLVSVREWLTAFERQSANLLPKMAPADGKTEARH